MGVVMADKAKDDSVKAAGSGKSQALNLAVSQIEKQFGSGSIMRLGDTSKIHIETISKTRASLKTTIRMCYCLMSLMTRQCQIGTE